MKIKLLLSVIVPLLSAVLSMNAFGAEPRTQICNFDGENASKIYSLTTMPGLGTTFKLPDGVKIDDFVVTDGTNFYSESNGVIGIVTPRVFGKSTSVIIYTDTDQLFVFNLSSEESDVVDQLVVVDINDQRLFRTRVRSEAAAIAQDQSARQAAQYEANLERESNAIRRQLLFSINSNYTVTGNVFSIEGVSDDGVFTYVKLARSQERPVVYFGRGGKPKELEVIRYTDEGDYYVIHRVLTAADKDRGFVLKLGDRISEIRRK
jgi:type IV secretory pathway VirB9-like protein